MQQSAHSRGAGIRQGFTLIELLVVIAIIGILSAVVLASLNTARTKGNDAAIKANLNTVRVQAGLYYDTHASSYNPAAASTVHGVDCGSTGATQPANTLLADSNVSRALIAVKGSSGQALYCNLKDDGTAYAFAAALPSGGYWCTDSAIVSRGAQSGGAAYTGISGATGTLTDGTDYTCN